ncbi:MAG: GNAT family N-acetyltransferase [Mangrovibacterium sp.]|jgi:ribosomal protein S18 acetylase RimI-like enzyme
MNGNVMIRTATSADLPLITHLEQLCFKEESFSERQLRYLATRAKADFLVAEEKGQIRAYLILLKRTASKGLRIYSVAVSPDHRGKGLARLLLNEAEKRARLDGNQYLTLEVSEINHEAIRLYLSSGFEVFGERSAYYKDGSKALLMRKQIDQALRSPK